MNLPSKLILTGPTACGKSALAIELAERIGGEIVAMDSMTLYRGMDIGTAKPTAAERARVPHHLLDAFEPWESATVAWWLAAAEAACAEIAARGKVAIIVGGTPFYLKSLLHGLFPGPPGDAELRQRLEAEAERDGKERLHARLAAVDAKTATRLHPNDVRRVVRALEVFELTGKPISDWQTTWDTAAFAGDAPGAKPAAIPAVRLELPREELYRRIDARVLAMLDAGWLDEVKRLSGFQPGSAGVSPAGDSLSSGVSRFAHASAMLAAETAADPGRPPLSREAKQALGYRELLDHLDGRGTWDETVTLIQTHTRQFAKRQMTWFRHLPQCVPVPADAPDAAEQVLQAWGKS